MTHEAGQINVERLALALVEAGAIQFGAFRLKLHEERPDAPLSPIYIDLRLLRSHPDQMDVAVAAYRALLQSCAFDLLADVPMAATPFVAIISHLTRIPMITPRQPKTHGSGASIDGAYRPGQTAVLIDDLVTKADSKLEAARVLEAEGLRVRDVVVLVDREQGGREQLTAAGYTLHAAVRFAELMDIYRRTGVIDDEAHARISDYMAVTR
ncbi:MAG: orotate phosphoribosyltransferase [Dehalococcoidia bacterium]